MAGVPTCASSDQFDVYSSEVALFQKEIAFVPMSSCCYVTAIPSQVSLPGDLTERLLSRKQTVKSSNIVQTQHVNFSERLLDESKTWQR